MTINKPDISGLTPREGMISTINIIISDFVMSGVCGGAEGDKIPSKPIK